MQTVLSVSTTATGQIVTGGEQGELCVWSPDGTIVGKHTFEGDDDITSVACSQRRPDLIYVAVGAQIPALDLKQLDTPLFTFRFNEEEINQLVLNEKEEYLAACDDSGHIKVINLFDKRVHKTLRKHTNICATVAFHPRRPWDLFSGGYDSKLIQWDFSRGRSVCVIDMEELGVHGGESSSYLINPPFVHSLATSNTGQYMACGTEGATIQLFHINKYNPEYFVTLCSHTQGVSQVHFPKSKPEHLVSGGNDGKILVWDMSRLSSCSTVSNGLPSIDSSNNQASSQAAHQPVPSNTPIFTIDHGGKVNWLTSINRNNETFLIVADNMNKVMIYPYPS
jgi:WD40 repeat protein